eukprot:GILJ01003073.1.p1 GENE.GILJ01003073.1~~GILJ01003073.1.p1  ORF type:complete len:1082 (+),score=206.50 GILJ01003073.1:190-3435(+)
MGSTCSKAKSVHYVDAPNTLHIDAKTGQPTTQRDAPAYPANEIEVALKAAKSLYLFQRDGHEKLGNVFKFTAMGPTGAHTVYSLAGEAGARAYYDPHNVIRDRPVPLEKDFFSGTCPVINGDAHRARKELLMKLFSDEAAAGYMVKLRQVMKEHTYSWTRTCNSDIVEMMRLLGTDMLCKVILGFPEHFVDSELPHLAQRVYGSMVAKSASLPVDITVPVLDIPVTPYATAKHAWTQMLGLVKYYLQALKTSPKGDSLAAILVRENAKLGADALTDDQLGRELMTLFQSGIGLVATLTHAVYFSAQDSIRRRLIAELDPLSKLTSLTPADFQNLPYTNQFCRELFRWSPVVTNYFSGVARQDFTVGDVRVPKDAKTIYCVWQSNRDKAVYPEPDTFDPDRFAPNEDVENTRPYTYQPFGVGAGPRLDTHRCAGEWFCDWAAKILLCETVTSSVVDVKVDGPSLTLDWHQLNPQPTNLSISFAPRFGPKITCEQAREEEEGMEKAREKYEYEWLLPAGIRVIDKKDKVLYNTIEDEYSPDLPPFIKKFDLFDKSQNMEGQVLGVFVVDKASGWINENVSEFVSKMKRAWSGEKKYEGATFAERITKKYTDLKYLWFPRPQATIEHWLIDDDIFVEQRLGGVHPLVIQKVHTVAEMQLTLESTLESKVASLVEGGNLFMCDYRIMDKLHFRVASRYVGAPVGLFELVRGAEEKDNKLVPIAIQLAKDGPWFYPSDSAPAWLFAKMYLQAADSTYHQGISHLGLTHLAHEPLCMAVPRQLPPTHPIYQLMFPHIRKTLEINEIARIDMLSRKKFIDEVLVGGRLGTLEAASAAWGAYDIEQRSLDADLTSRSVDRANLPVSYPFRDDAMPINDAIKEFVGSIVDVFYPADADIVNDVYLQSFAQEMHEVCGKKEKRFPSTLTSRDQLKLILSTLIFRVSVGHWCVNAAQYDTYGFLPNGCPYLRVPPPTDKSAITFDTIEKALPDEDAALKSLAMSHLLSMPSYDTFMRRLTATKDLYKFENVNAQDCVGRFQTRLHQAQEQVQHNIAQRSERYLRSHPGAEHVPRCVEYPYLDPNDLPVSVAI